MGCRSRAQPELEDAVKSAETLAIFNRGIVSKKAQARLDVDRVTMSAEMQVNWMPRTLGPMALRPGTARLGNIKGNATGVYVPFVFAVDDVALIEMTPGMMRVWDNGDTLLLRPAVTAAITNGGFASDLTGWTDADETGATSVWSAGAMKLTGTRYTEARRRQAVTVNEAGTLHALRVTVARGPVFLRLGTSAGADDVFPQVVLRTGTHSIAFTPTGTLHIEIASSVSYPTLVDDIAVEAPGVVEWPTPWGLADLSLMRWQQIGDLVFVACDGHQQRRIERRANGSWSIVLYEANDGPFVGPSTDGVRMTPSALSGEITLTASRTIFGASSVGQLLRLTSQGQQVSASLSASDAFTGHIRVTGIGSGRHITVARAGTWAGTLRLQRSIGEPGSWVTVASYTTNASTNYDDDLDNVIAYYRIGFGAGDYTSGTADVSLTAASGSITGVVRVTGVTSATSAAAVVLSDLGGTAATEAWEAGSWSEDGYPTAVAFYEGRLWWAGRGRIWASIADAFDRFDPDFEGDAGPINRGVGDGAVDRINWLLPVLRLIAGSGSAEHVIRSTSFDEPLSPTNFNVKAPSTQGGAPSPPGHYDKRGVYIQRSGVRVYEMSYDIQDSDYGSIDLTALVPELGEIGFVRLIVQRQPDTRVYALRTDGTAAVLVRDPAEDVLAWVEVETDGAIEDVAVLPGTIEDRVFWLVQRTVNGATVRFHEEMAREDQCRGGALSRLADAHVVYSGAATSTIEGLEYLEGESVVAWGDGADLGSFTVSGGQVVLASEVSEACVGLGYRARYRSNKPPITAQVPALGLTQRKRIDHLGLILENTHYQGLRYGPDFETMDELPLIDDEQESSGVWESYDKGMVEFPGDWGVDARLCLEANAPRPCTVMAAVLNVVTEAK